MMKENVWKNYLNFVKHVNMIYVHFTIIVIKVSKKKNKEAFCPTPCNFQLHMGTLVVNCMFNLTTMRRYNANSSIL